MLRALYAGAVLFPSRMESFGLPPLEAMAYGLSVAVSRIPAVEKVCDDAALYFDLQDVDGMAQTITRLVTDGGLRRDLSVRGRAQAGLFTWVGTARRTARVLSAADR